MTRAAPELARLLADHLEGAGIPYAIGGALALAVWGFPRATNDVDLDVFVAPEGLEPVFDALVGAECEVDRLAARSSAAERGDFKVRLDGMRIDVFIPTRSTGRTSDGGWSTSSERVTSAWRGGIAW